MSITVEKKLDEKTAFLCDKQAPPNLFVCPNSGPDFQLYMLLSSCVQSVKVRDDNILILVELLTITV
jgi:hypothetical protein